MPDADNLNPSPAPAPAPGPAATGATSPRDRIVALLRDRPRTVSELAEALGVAGNTIRVHIATLERAGTVHAVGSRRGEGVGKPAAEYALVPAAETQLSRAYVPFLSGVLDAMRDRLPEGEYHAALLEAGRHLAPGAPTDAPVEARISHAASVLEALGAALTVEREPGRCTIRGAGCPLGAVTSHHPAVCDALAAMLSQTLDLDVATDCDREGRPACRFAITYGETS